jgi:hypothetical protein
MKPQIQYPNPGFVWKLTPNKRQLLENLSEEQKEDLIDGINGNASEAVIYCNALVPGERGLIAKETFRQTIEKHATRTLFVFYRTDLEDVLIRTLTEGEIEEIPIQPWMTINELEAQLTKARWERFPMGKHPHEIFWSAFNPSDS